MRFSPPSHPKGNSPLIRRYLLFNQTSFSSAFFFSLNCFKLKRKAELKFDLIEKQMPTNQWGMLFLLGLHPFYSIRKSLSLSLSLMYLPNAFILGARANLGFNKTCPKPKQTANCEPLPNGYSPNRDLPSSLITLSKSRFSQCHTNLEATITQ